MAGINYTIDFSDSTLTGKAPFTVEAGTRNSDTSLYLIGQGYPRYGESVNENFIKLLENFASRTAPARPTMGQLWYDGNTNTLKVYNNVSTWVALGGGSTGTTYTAGSGIIIDGSVIRVLNPLPMVPPGSNGQVLTVSGGMPGWAVPTGGTGSYLPLAGGTLTGPLTLSASPTLPLQAATKGYVDGRVPLVGTGGHVLTMTTTGPQWQAATGTISATGSTLIMRNTSGDACTRRVYVGGSSSTESTNFYVGTDNLSTQLFAGSYGLVFGANSGAAAVRMPEGGYFYPISGPNLNDLGQESNAWRTLFVSKVTLGVGRGCEATTTNTSYNFWGDTSLYSVSSAPGTVTLDCGTVLGLPANTGWTSMDWSRTQARSHVNLIPNVDNLRNLGGSGLRWASIWSANSVIQTSDERLKNFEGSTEGLDFINKIEPVKYTWKVGGYNETASDTEVDVIRQEPIYEEVVDYPGQPPRQVQVGVKDITRAKRVCTPVEGQRIHYGFKAQQVKQTLDELGIEDFGGWILADKNDPDSEQSLRYDEFIAPLVKAVQELSAQVKVLQEEVLLLKSA